MTTNGDYNKTLENIAKLKTEIAEAYANARPGDTQALALLNQQLQSTEEQLLSDLDEGSQPNDLGLSGLIGLGGDAVKSLDDAPAIRRVQAYDDNVSAQRLYAVAHLYYLAQQERAGIFRAVLKLQNLFKSGQVRLSSGQGALLLYQYDRKRVLQYSMRERMQAYSRVFGYTKIKPTAGSRPNTAFHGLFENFNQNVARYFRDKRISDVISPDTTRDSFGSIATVRRAGLDLRNNLKKASYGHINVMTLEISQLLDNAFSILGAEDVRSLFGADDAWEVLEGIFSQYMKKDVRTSELSRLGVVGRRVLLWLSEGYIVNDSRPAFEANLIDIAEDAEEWLTVASSLGEVSSRPQKVRSSNIVPIRRKTG